MLILLVLLIIAQTVISAYVFKFQRYTLKIGRIHSANHVKDIQILLTPNWIGFFGWLSKGLIILIIALLIINKLWLFLIIYLILAFIGLAIIDMINPVPSKERAYKLMKKTLDDDSRKLPPSIERIKLSGSLSDYMKEI